MIVSAIGPESVVGRLRDLVGFTRFARDILIPLVAFFVTTVPVREAPTVWNYPQS